MYTIYRLDKAFKEVKKIDTRHKYWIQCSKLTKEEAAELQKILELHPLTTEDILNRNIRIKVEEFTEYIFCVFYTLRGKEPVELDFVVGKNFVLSHGLDLDISPTTAAAALRKGPDFLFHLLIDQEVDHTFEELQKLSDQIDHLEDAVIKEASPKTLSRIHAVRRTTSNLRRIFLTQREKLGMLAKTELPLISAKSRPYFRDVYDHSIRVSDALESYKEAASNVFEIYMSSVSNNMNEVMKTLSIIATIALPLTVVSGVYGTNFLLLPGSKHPAGFWIMVGLMGVMILGMLVYFRKRRWI